MCSGRGDGPLRPPGFPIRKSPDRSLVADSPGLIAGSYVLLRLLVPRHPPCALINLATTDDARVHCAVLKIRAAPVASAARRCSATVRVEETSLAAVPSGPNSVLGPVCPRDLAFHATADTAAVLASPGNRPDRITSAPLMSCHLKQRFPTTGRLRCGSGPGRRSGQASCSLERR